MSLKFKVLLLVLLSLMQGKVFAQSFGGERKESIYISSSNFEEDESHLSFGLNIPIWKNDSSSHKVGLSQETSSLGDEIQNKFKEQDFYSTSISWTYTTNRDAADHFPWVATLGYKANGHKSFENNREDFSFKLMTGFKSESSMHNYGVALSSNGALKGIPFPFYVYTTTLLSQNLTIGFPFVSLSGPRQNSTNYYISLSPGGATFKLLQKVDDDFSMNLFWRFDVDSYVVDNQMFSDKESLLIEKQTVALEGNYRVTKAISIELSLGREYAKRYFKGENIFNKEDEKLHLVSQNFIKSGISFTF